MKQAKLAKPPLYAEGFTTVRLRVAVALVARHYRKDPPLFEHPPYGIVVLAGLLRAQVPGCCLHPELVFLAKAVSAGHRLSDIPWIPRERAMRSISKRRLVPSRR